MRDSKPTTTTSLTILLPVRQGGINCFMPTLLDCGASVVVNWAAPARSTGKTRFGSYAYMYGCICIRPITALHSTQYTHQIRHPKLHPQFEVSWACGQWQQYYIRSLSTGHFILSEPALPQSLARSDSCTRFAVQIRGPFMVYIGLRLRATLLKVAGNKFMVFSSDDTTLK